MRNGFWDGPGWLIVLTATVVALFVGGLSWG